jgi:hypothetical protein
MTRALSMAVVSIGLLGAPEAAAQTATACLTPAGKITQMALGEEPARPCNSRQTEVTFILDGENDSPIKVVPFFVTLDGDGAEEAVATNGPLEAFVRCLVNDSSIGGADRIKLLATSTIDGWWAGGSEPSLADEEFDMGEFENNVHGQRRFGARSNLIIRQNSVIAPGGYVINVDFDEVANEAKHL